jgi:hypothetical protein
MIALAGGAASPAAGKTLIGGNVTSARAAVALAANTSQATVIPMTSLNRPAPR